MGWWRVREVESGGIDWSHRCPTNDQLVNAIPGEETEEALYNGDQPADLMDSILDEINEEYKKAWGRPVKKEELIAVFNFCCGGKFDGTGTYIGGEESMEEEKMSGNGRGKQEKAVSPLTRIEQMEILTDHANAAFKMLEVLMWDDRIDDADVRWRVDSFAGALAMIGNEISSALCTMQEEEDDGAKNDISRE
ncbi:MAG: hypothetical protein H8D67_30855 [Deltaproteobacteria bacterium]|nr:hypothetical protein [Deltaproteobacteria bacterium]